MKNVLVFGAGAIGATVAVWLKDSEAKVSVFDRKEVADHINEKGIEIYHGDQPQTRYFAKPAAYSNLDDVPTPDIIVLCVKNYSLDAVSQVLQDKFGKDTIIVALQNGVENQAILPKYFNKVIYGVVCYNAWVDEPAIVGYQKKGPIALGKISNQQDAPQVSDQEIREVSRLFNQGVETDVPANLNDAAHSKIVINLTNSLTTLVALHENDLSRSKQFQKLLTTMTYEGVKVMEAAGYKESKLGGMPGWLLIKAAGILPGFVTRRPYSKNLKKMVVSSMAQDIIVNGGNTSELETINGYVLALAKQHNVEVPVNQGIYDLCKKEFTKRPFQPLTVQGILDKIA